jgi:holin-like protein
LLIRLVNDDPSGGSSQDDGGGRIGFTGPNHQCEGRRMIVSLTCLLVCQLAGEALVRGFGWSVPGPVLGMALLLVLLVVRERIRPLPAELRDGSLEATGKGLLGHLSLLFVPAGVGVVQRLGVLAAQGFALAAALVISTLLTLAVTVLTFRAASRLAQGDDGAADDP